MFGEEKGKIDILKGHGGRQEQTYLNLFKMIGEEESNIDILKATVNRCGEEQDRDPEGHSGRQEQTDLNVFKMTGEEENKIEILKATVDRRGEEQDRDPEGDGGPRRKRANAGTGPRVTHICVTRGPLCCCWAPRGGGKGRGTTPSHTHLCDSGPAALLLGPPWRGQGQGHDPESHTSV